jgi:hypothetical protein
MLKVAVSHKESAVASGLHGKHPSLSDIVPMNYRNSFTRVANTAI